MISGAVMVFAIALIVAFCADAIVNGGKIYDGVKVGEVDVSGMTVDQAASALESHYGARVSGTSVTLYASEEAKAAAKEGQGQSEHILEQRDVEEARASSVSWSTNAQSLQASFDARSFAEQAFAVGRDDGGLFGRLRARLFGVEVSPAVDFVEESLETLLEEVDVAIGDPRVDWGVVVENGFASTTEGHDGWMVDRESFGKELESAFLQTEGGYASLVVHADYAPLRIDQQSAQSTADAVNAAISNGATLAYGDEEWFVDPATLGNWTEFKVEGAQDEGYRLAPSIDRNLATSSIVSVFEPTFGESGLSVSFDKDDSGNVIAHMGSGGIMPDIGKALDDLQAVLYGSQAPSDHSAFTVQVSQREVPESMEVDEAISLGLVICISRYETQYSSNVKARNHNIHLASDLIDNSVVKADGGEWSFNGTAGNCNEEAGFQSAGSIVAGEYTDEIGGGICQVATTVFNAVYDAGFPILSRWNHSLYMASYPAGRDAAVSYPDLDLRWSNDSGSDVLLRMSYTSSSVTCELYGVDPGYSVETKTGQWEEGEKYSTEIEVDETLPSGSSYVKTAGTNGKKITIVRTVTDKNGTLLREDVFESDYDPINEVKVVGPDSA